MVKKFVNTFITAVLLLLCGSIILRCCASADRSTMTDIIPNDVLCQAYAADTLTVLTTHDNAAEISADGYFSAYSFVYLPECSQVQFTVRYNESVYEYHNIPVGSEFTYTLGKADDAERVVPTSVTAESKGIYQYRRLVFDNITVDEDDVLYCYMQISDSYESQHPIRYAEQPLVERKFTSAEKRALTSGE